MRLLIVFVSLLSCFNLARAHITVSCASSLQDVMSELAKNYPQGGAEISFNFGASGQLKSQIEAGAPVDLFIPASEKDLKATVGVDKASIKQVAGNALVLIAFENANLSKIQDLEDPKIKKIAMGNPKTVPAGLYASEALAHYKIDMSSPKMKEKLVLGETVRQVLDYVVQGEVDAAFVFATDYLSAKDKKIKKVMEIPAKAHEEIIYSAGLIQTSKNKDAALLFINFISDKKNQKTWEKYGFKFKP